VYAGPTSAPRRTPPTGRSASVRRRTPPASGGPLGGLLKGRSARRRLALLAR